MNVVGYCRVSTNNQKEEGTIQIQQDSLREYSKSKGYVLNQTLVQMDIIQALLLKRANMLNPWVNLQ